MEVNHILIVEDDKDIREAVGIYLRSQGYQVFQAENGLEGLDILEKEEIHLAIVDIMMPCMDGITMTMKLREKYDFPVIMLSAKSEEVDKVMGLNIGADDYVTKPFTPMELMARVNSQLRRYKRFMEKLQKQEAENEQIRLETMKAKLDEDEANQMEKLKSMGINSYEDLDIEINKLETEINSEIVKYAELLKGE